MKLFILILVLGISILNIACTKNLYGTYNTNNSPDKSAFYQIKLLSDSTVEKTEIHTISIFAKGKFLITNKNDVICFFDSSKTQFPADTLILRFKKNKLYFKNNGKINKQIFLTKQ